MFGEKRANERTKAIAPKSNNRVVAVATRLHACEFALHGAKHRVPLLLQSGTSGLSPGDGRSDFALVNLIHEVR